VVARVLPYSSSVTDPQAPGPLRPVPYKGAPLDADRGPGLGCFRFQLTVLVVLVVLAPLSAWWGAPDWLSATLLVGVIVLTLVTGQTIIFLLRLVAADRRAAGRRRPVAGRTPTVGQIEDESTPPKPGPDGGPRDEGAVRE
jgi:hypothetical protein